MRIIAFITDVGSIQHPLAYLGEPTQAPRVAPTARGPPPFEEGSEPRKGTDLSERAASESLARRGCNDRTSPANPGTDALRPTRDRVRSAGESGRRHLLPNLPARLRARPAPVGSRPGIRPSPVHHPEARQPPLLPPRRAWITGRSHRRYMTCCNIALNVLSFYHSMAMAYLIRVIHDGQDESDARVPLLRGRRCRGCRRTGFGLISSVLVRCRLKAGVLIDAAVSPATPSPALRQRRRSGSIWLVSRPAATGCWSCTTFHVEDRNPRLDECVAAVFLAAWREDGRWEEPERFPMECASANSSFARAELAPGGKRRCQHRRAPLRGDRDHQRDAVQPASAAWAA